MNFKDAYKSANDSIHADRALIDAIHSKAQKSKNTFRYPAYLGLAAAAAVITLVFGAANMGEKHIQKNETYVANNDISLARTAKTTETDIEDNSPLDTTGEEQLKENYSYKAIEKNRNDELSKAASDEIFADNTYDSASDFDQAEGEGAYIGAEDYGISMASIEVETTEGDVKTLSKEQYFEYIGTDIISSAKLPADMKFTAFDGTELLMDENGNITDDKALFTAYNENKERNITIEVTKIAPKAKTSNDYQTLNDIKTVEITREDCTYSITAFNVTDEELEELVKSLKQ